MPLDVISAGGLILINVCIINGGIYIFQAQGRPSCSQGQLFPRKGSQCHGGHEGTLGGHRAEDGDGDAAGDPPVPQELSQP